jgi:hypothetical protein
MDFYQIVILIAIAALSMIMIWFAYTIRNGNNTSTFPPVSNVCPDTWTQMNNDNSTVTCTATSTNTNMGTAESGGTLPSDSSSDDPTYTYTASPATYVMYPNSARWSNSGITPVCAQKRWTDAYQIQWSGVSNTNAC